MMLAMDFDDMTLEQLGDYPGTEERRTELAGELQTVIEMANDMLGRAQRALDADRLEEARDHLLAAAALCEVDE